MRSLAIVLSFWLAIPCVARAGDLVTERVFGPEVPTGPYKHPASLAELDNGDLYLVYYGGNGEYAKDTAVYGSRRRHGETAWSAPVAIARDPFRSLGNGLIWQAPDGVVWLFYVVRFGDTWSTSRIACKISTDQAVTWSDSSILALDEGMMIRNRPIVLASGDYLLPIYRETGADPESVGPDSVSLFLKYQPKTKVWTTSGPIRSKNGNIQPAAVELEPGHLVAYCRRGGDYSPQTRGFIVRAESRDSGMTWSEGVNSAFPNPNAAIDFLKLKNEHLLLIYNDSFTGRTPIKVALSVDRDQTYPRSRNLVEGPGDFGYPLAFQARDGQIHVVYTSERRSVINHATFDESWILQGASPR